VLLTPVNADSKTARFHVVDVALTDYAENLDWLNHIRDIRVLPSSNALPPNSSLGEPVRLAPNLWLGDASHARDVEGLARLNITAIVNVAGRMPHWEATPDYPASWDYLKVDLCSEFEAAYNQKVSLLGDNFQRIFVFMDRCAQSGRNIFVHCMTGMGRAPTVCVAFLMLRFHWTLPKALRCVLSHLPCAIEEETFQEELLALAKANELLVRDHNVTQLLEDAEGPAAQVWRLAAGTSLRIYDRKKLLEAMRSLCPREVEMSEVDVDLQALESEKGVIGWQQFKRWFLIGQMKACRMP